MLLAHYGPPSAAASEVGEGAGAYKPPPIKLEELSDILRDLQERVLALERNAVPKKTEK